MCTTSPGELWQAGGMQVQVSNLGVGVCTVWGSRSGCWWHLRFSFYTLVFPDAEPRLHNFVTQPYADFKGKTGVRSPRLHCPCTHHRYSLWCRLSRRCILDLGLRHEGGSAVIARYGNQLLQLRPSVAALFVESPPAEPLQSPGADTTNPYFVCRANGSLSFAKVVYGWSLGTSVAASLAAKKSDVPRHFVGNMSTVEGFRITGLRF